MEIETQKIESLTVENFLRVKFAEINFKDDLVVLGGENGAGKSSVAKALWALLNGKKGVPEQPVHNNEGEAKLTAVLDGDFILEAIIQPDRSMKLILKDKEGGRYGNANELLKAFEAEYSLRPEEWLELSEKEQVNELLKLTGLDLDKFERERSGAFEGRTTVSRELKGAEARFKALPHYPDAPEQETAISDLMQEMKAAQELKGKKEQNAINAVIARNEAGKYTNEVNRLEAEIIKLKEAAEKQIALAKTFEKTAAEIEVPDTAELEGRIKEIDETNKRVRANKVYQELYNQVAALTNSEAELTAKIESVDQRKEAAIKEAKFPVEGLGFSETGVTLNGVPLAQASDAERWKAAVMIGFAMKPKLKLVYIRHAGMMTGKTRKTIYDLVRELGGQLLVEVPGDAADVTVVMEDGVSHLK